MGTDNRGRPRGSTKSVHRVRRDYRFSQETLDHLAQGRARTDDSSNETAFVEQAIAHYTAFLEGSIQSQMEMNQKVERLQAQVRDLERDLVLTQQALREARTKHQTALPPSVPSARPTARKPLYEILVRHDPGPCPALPDDSDCLYTQKSEHQCPVHQVFEAACPIDHARRRIEALKQVPGLSRIWLTRNGYATPQDDWQRKNGAWQRTG